MSMSMYASTKLVSPSIAAEDIDSAEALDNVSPCQFSKTADLIKYSNGEQTINYAYGDSRSDFFRYAVKKLCKLSGISGLEFFFGDPDGPCRWKFPMGDEDSEGEIYGYELGYWLVGEALLAAKSQLTLLLEWSEKNIPAIAVVDFLGYFANEADIAKAIIDGKSMSGPRMKEAMYAEDGDGPGYLFAYLGTCEKIFANAIKSNNAVLHVSEYYL